MKGVATAHESTWCHALWTIADTVLITDDASRICEEDLIRGCVRSFLSTHECKDLINSKMALGLATLLKLGHLFTDNTFKDIIWCLVKQELGFDSCREKLESLEHSCLQFNINYSNQILLRSGV